MVQQEAKKYVSDYSVEQEHDTGFPPTMERNNKKLNIIDRPGSDDFIGGAITALNVTDQAVILITDNTFRKSNTNNFRYTEKLKKPVIFLLISFLTSTNAISITLYRI